MFDDYKKEVILTYQKKKNDRSLSPNLYNPTPRKLKDECLLVYRERYSYKDDHTLRLFFGVKEKDGSYRQNIERVDIDRFKSLVKLLKGEKIIPHEKNYKLLAWLINFEEEGAETGPVDGERPQLEDGNSGKSGNTENAGILLDSVTAHPEEKKLQTFVPGISGKKGWGSKSKLKNAVILFIGIAAVSTGVYWRVVGNHQQCMYWTGDEYQAISCNETAGDRMIIAMDTEKLSSLKRITRQDTITKWAIGKTFYFKVNPDSIDVFTAPGFHPLHRERKLTLLSYHMYTKYIRHN